MNATTEDIVANMTTYDPVALDNGTDIIPFELLKTNPVLKPFLAISQTPAGTAKKAILATVMVLLIIFGSLLAATLWTRKRREHAEVVPTPEPDKPKPKSAPPPLRRLSKRKKSSLSGVVGRRPPRTIKSLEKLKSKAKSKVWREHLSISSQNSKLSKDGSNQRSLDTSTQSEVMLIEDKMTTMKSNHPDRVVDGNESISITLTH